MALNMTDTRTIIAELHAYIEQAEKERFNEEHDKRFHSLRRRVDERSGSLRPPLNVLAKRLYVIADHSFFCTQLFDHKFFLLAKGIVHALESENALALANNARSLLEQVAVLSFYMEAVAGMLVGLENQATIEKIDPIVLKTEKLLNRVYAGKGRKLGTTKEEQAIHVNDAIAALDRHLADASRAYDYLCEFVHPNFGNNLLVSSGTLGTGKIDGRKGDDPIVARIATICLALLRYIRDDMQLSHAYLTGSVHHLVELCFQRTAKLANVFSKKSPLPIGDGKTQETAFFFKNARTAQEAMALEYEFLRNTGYVPRLEDKTVGAIDDGFIYDVWNTQAGRMWFRIPFLKIPPYRS